MHTPWEAGRYVRSMAPVQHDVARFEDIDPANGWRAEVEVRRATARRPLKEAPAGRGS